MKKRPIEKMLDIIISKDESIIHSSSYQRVKKTLEKKTEELTYADKYALREELRSLCGACGLSYERLLLKVNRD